MAGWDTRGAGHLTNKVSYSHLGENGDNSRGGTTAWWVRTQPAWRSDRTSRDHV